MSEQLMYNSINCQKDCPMKHPDLELCTHPCVHQHRQKSVLTKDQIQKVKEWFRENFRGTIWDSRDDYLARRLLHVIHSNQKET